MKLLRIAAWACWFLLSWTLLAQAGPVVMAVGAIAGAVTTAIGALGTIGQIVLGIALQVGASLLQRATQKEQLPPGIRGDVAVGGVNSVSFLVGTYASAGSLEYVNTWGRSGDTPNAYVTQVVSLSDMPITGLAARVWVNGEQCTIDFGDTSYEMGFPVTEFETDGDNNHFWVKPNLGDQTAADAFLVDKFSADPERPWLPDMIGRGIAYLSVTTQFEREFFTGVPKVILEAQGIPLYDPRLDTSVGGSGPQRWNQPETYAFTDNPVVIAYNIMRGIYYDGVWIYGPEVPATRLPLSNWFAAMNECDVLIPLAGGGSEKQFRCGYEIRTDEMEPVAVIDELLLACNGRMAEIGGVYKVHVGAPALPSYFFTDEDIVVTEGQSFEPFPGYESTYNGASASYPEPLMAWEMKDAPQYRNAGFEAEDFGEIKLAGLTLNAVPFALQVQRIMRSITNDNRRFRRHQHTLPPEAWLFEPLDTFSWTSERNGYINKQFLVTGMDDLGNANQNVALLETDPSDYDWSSSFELPWSVGSLTPQFPPPQVMSGWQVAPAILYDNDGTARRPSIEVFFDGDRDDVEYVRVQVRLTTTQAAAFDGRVTYDRQDAPGQVSVILDGSFLPATDYEVRGKFVPFSGRRTDWSSWLPVTTPDVKLVPGKDFDPFEGVIGFDQLGDDLAGYQEWIGDGLREVERRLEELDQWIADQDFGNEYDRQKIRTQITATFDTARADYTEQIDVVAAENLALASRMETLTAEVDATATAVDILEVEVGPQGALANAITALSAAAVNGDVNTANFRMQVLSGPTGYSSIGFEARQDGAGDYRSAGFFLDVPNNPGLPTRATVQADQFVVIDGSGVKTPFIIQGGVLYANALRVKWANIDEVSVNNAQIENAAITSAKIADLSVNTIKIAGTAINVTATSFTAGSNSIGASFDTIQSVTINVPSDALFVRVILQFDASYSGVSSAIERVQVDGGEVMTQNPPWLFGGAPQMEFVWMTPSSGNHTFAWQVRVSQGGGSPSINTSNRRMHAYAQRR